MDLKSREWDISYINQDNFVYYPHEEIIRFTSKYIRKRIGYAKFIDHTEGTAPPKVIDLGCGIGRHVKFLHEYQLDAYGIDLSPVAVEAARSLFNCQGLNCLNDRLTVGSLTAMPYTDGFFDFALSHGVFDSMPFDVARTALKESARCLKNGGLLYLDLISGDDSSHHPEFCDEEVVTTAHEKGTIQSYFNWQKINTLCEGLFVVLEGTLIRKTSVVKPGFHSRYHLVLKNTGQGRK